MAERGEKLGGTERAAVLLMSLGEEVAAEVLTHMGPKEVQKVGTTEKAGPVSRDHCSQSRGARSR